MKFTRDNLEPEEELLIAAALPAAVSCASIEDQIVWLVEQLGVDEVSSQLEEIIQNKAEN